jgi:hypothetical protein
VVVEDVGRKLWICRGKLVMVDGWEWGGGDFWDNDGMGFENNTKESNLRF